MPNQNVQKIILDQCEIIAQNLDYIDSLTALVIDSRGACADKNDIDNAMLVIAMLQRQTSEATAITQRLSHEAMQAGQGGES